MRNSLYLIVHAAFVLVLCEHNSARRRARRGVVRAADAYLRHIAEGVVREVVALPRERARADAAFACERRELAGRKECRSISCDILLQI